VSNIKKIPPSKFCVNFWEILHSPDLIERSLQGNLCFPTKVKKVRRQRFCIGRARIVLELILIKTLAWIHFQRFMIFLLKLSKGNCSYRNSWRCRWVDCGIVVSLYMENIFIKSWINHKLIILNRYKSFHNFLHFFFQTLLLLFLFPFVLFFRGHMFQSFLNLLDFLFFQFFQNFFLFLFLFFSLMGISIEKCFLSRGIF